ncbi:MAG: P-loop NTPase fold protein [Collinsella sp.]
MQADEITEVIKSYMQCDDIDLQALVLHGEWGSGKTYYCENDLKTALNKMDIKICRVSLFGVSNYEEALNRVIASCLPLSEKAVGGICAAISALVKNAIKAGSSMLNNKIEDLGIQFSLKPDLLLPLLDTKNALVIFDDCERSSFAHDDRTFLGFVNNMVENHGWHVMLVRNKPLSFEDENSVEKAIMSQIMFEPDLQTLYQGLVKPRLQFPEHIDFDIDDAIIDGIKGSAINVRALSRSIPTINYVLSTSVLVDKTVKSSGRAQALSNFISYAVRASAGNTPKKPDTSNKAVNMIDNSEFIEYENYLLISKALAPLTEGGNVSPNAIEHSFKEYVIAENPESAADLEAQDIENQWFALPWLEDDQVKLLANQLELLLTEGRYSQGWFYKIIRIALNLIDLGFWDEAFREKLLESLRLAANRDPKCNADKLRQERAMANDFYGMNANQIMDELISSVEKEESERALNRISLELSDVNGDTGNTLSELFKEAMQSGYSRTILNVPAEYVAASIYEGTAASQMSLHSFFNRDIKKYSDGQSLTEAIKWLRSIDDRLVKVGFKSRMGQLRTECIRNDFKEAIEELDERAQHVSADSDTDM